MGEPNSKTVPIILVALIAAVGTVVALAIAWNFDWRPLVNLFAELGG